jgi:hypothetical protein
MHVSSDSSSPPKGSRTKPKSEAVAAPKKVARPRKKAAAETAETPVEIVSLTQSVPPPTEMIAEAAYFIAAQRNFAPGHELDDWLAAERLMSNPSS